MSFRCLVFACVFLPCVFPQAAGADDPTSPVKWSQLPDMGTWGYDWSSETTVPSMAADDFLCSSPLAVVDLHWWGSYYKPGVLWPWPNSDNLPDPTLATGQPPGILQGFLVEFYSDVPAGVDPGMPDSHPGIVLYEQFVPITQVAESFYGQVVHIGNIKENVWQYNCDLPVPFYQDPDLEPVDVDGDGQPDGTIYWLKIQAVHSDMQIQWGWHEAVTLWRDNAVQAWQYVGQHPDQWETLVDSDLAFELTFVPEPSLLLAGLLGLLLLVKFRR
jgi:hypothetical protein